MTLPSWRARPTKSAVDPTPEIESSRSASSQDVAALMARAEHLAKARPPAVRYVGFQTTKVGREYSCRVTDPVGLRLFVLLITHKAFAAREVRFQDAPDLCFARLSRELAADPDLVPGEPLVLTSQELLEYRNIREHRAPSRKRGGGAAANAVAGDAGS